MKLNKTQSFIKKNQNRKIGIFLPTLKQYNEMDKNAKRGYQKAVRLYTDPHHVTKQAQGFEMFTRLTAMNGPATSKRRIRAANTIANLRQVNMMQKVEIGNPRFYSGKLDTPQLNQRRALMETFKKGSMRQLKDDNDIIRERSTKYAIYQPEDNNPNFYIIVDLSTEAKTHGRGARVDMGSKNYIRAIWNALSPNLKEVDMTSDAPDAGMPDLDNLPGGK